MIICHAGPSASIYIRRQTLAFARRPLTGFGDTQAPGRRAGHRRSRGRPRPGIRAG